jgi:hypothetical protein
MSTLFAQNLNFDIPDSDLILELQQNCQTFPQLKGQETFPWELHQREAIGKKAIHFSSKADIDDVFSSVVYFLESPPVYKVVNTLLRETVEPDATDLSSFINEPVKDWPLLSTTCHVPQGNSALQIERLCTKGRARS